MNGEYFPLTLPDFDRFDDVVDGLFHLVYANDEKDELLLYFVGTNYGGIVGVEVDKENNNLKRLVLKGTDDEASKFKLRKADYVNSESQSVLSMVV